MIDELLEYNRAFVGKKGYEKYLTNKYPDKKIAIVTCMDTRLVELIPAALGLKNVIVRPGSLMYRQLLTLIRCLELRFLRLVHLEKLVVIAHIAVKPLIFHMINDIYYAI